MVTLQTRYLSRDHRSIRWPRAFLFQIQLYRKNSKVQKRGKINLIGRLQLTTERMREEENEGIVQLRILRTQVQRWARSMQVERLVHLHLFWTPPTVNKEPHSAVSWPALLFFHPLLFHFSRPGGHHPNNEDEEAHQQRSAADGAGGNPKEHVFTTEEDDQGADWVADRP